MAHKVGSNTGGRGGKTGGGQGGAKSGGKSRPGARQPAGRKSGTAGASKSGQSGKSGSGGYGKSSSGTGAQAGKGRRQDAGTKTYSKPSTGGQARGAATKGGPSRGPESSGGPARSPEYKGGASRGAKPAGQPARGGQGRTADVRGGGRSGGRANAKAAARIGAKPRTDTRVKVLKDERLREFDRTRGDDTGRTLELDNKVVGVNPVMELLRSGGRTIDTVFVDSEKGGKAIGDIIKAAREHGITVKFAPKEALDKMSIGLRHQGAVAVVSPKPYADPDELVAAAFNKSETPLFVLLDGVEDPQNLGAIIRTADCAGVDGVFIPEHRAAHLSASVARASAGALEHVPVAKVKNLAAFIDRLKERGVWVVGVEAGSGKKHTGIKLDMPVAVVMGGEGTGVRPVVLKSCDAVVSLPMMGRVNSLNVSVATGIMLYEALRQRAAKG